MGHVSALAAEALGMLSLSQPLPCSDISLIGTLFFQRLLNHSSAFHKSGFYFIGNRPAEKQGDDILPEYVPDCAVPPGFTFWALMCRKILHIRLARRCHSVDVDNLRLAGKCWCFTVSGKIWEVRDL